MSYLNIAQVLHQLVKIISKLVLDDCSSLLILLPIST
jgi:hypothetical protein